MLASNSKLKTQNLKPAQRGVALVITLIMLSVITFLTVAFLTLTRRERGATDTAQHQTDAQLMAEVAQSRAQLELVAKMMAQNSLLVGDMQVSRNYIRSGGYTNQPLGNIDTNNVHYDFRDDGSPLSPDEKIRNIANLYFDPRPPVYVKTNASDATNDFRFYLDLNRNRRFETNGFAAVITNEAGDPLVTNGTAVVSNFFVGDPEWIGMLERPEFPHSPTNRFVGRYAYLVQAEGKNLDFNFMHNYGKGANGLPFNMNGGDGFLRNQGVGSWELNLAGFLYNLNTNYWGITYLPAQTNGFSYRTTLNQANGNTALGGDEPAFEDAFSFLKYRYQTNYNSQLSVMAGLGTFGRDAFLTDNVDGYADGPLATNNLSLTNEFVGSTTADPTGTPWAGSRNTNAYHQFDELWDSNKTSHFFVERMKSMSEKTNSYDRYTFYRMLAQAGTHSTPDKTRMNLNYDNLTPTNRNTGDTNYWTASATNFLPWTPLGFFTNAAERLINRSLVNLYDTDPNRTLTNKSLDGFLVGTNFSFTNIQIYPTNLYTPTVHRLLQLAANIYAATTNEVFNGTGGNLTNAPYIFRPQFSQLNAYATNIIVISGYQEVTNDWKAQLARGFLDLNVANDRNAIPFFPGKSDTNAYGIPWVVSVKKGFPNFNELVLETGLRLTRKLQFRKSSPTAFSTMRTNQMLLLAITNYSGVEIWNSSTNVSPKNLQVVMTNVLSMTLTNENGGVVSSSGGALNITRPLGTQGLLPNGLAGRAFLVPFSTNFLFLTNSQFYGGSFRRVTNNNPQFESSSGYPLPNWTLLATNRLIYALVDGNTDRLLDFVNITQTTKPMQLTNLLYDSRTTPLGPPFNPPSVTRTGSELWNPERANGATAVSVPTLGVENQILVGLGESNLKVKWTTQTQGSTFSGSPEEQIAKFAKFLGRPPFSGNSDYTNLAGVYAAMPLPTNTVADAPYNPTMVIAQRLSFQANDPLVHYLAEDVYPGSGLAESNRVDGSLITLPALSADMAPSLGALNWNYRPWGGNPQKTDDTTDRVLALKDPLVTSSDNWDFPTNKFANVGWLGRVHRGTPWQTVYLKSDNINVTNWTKWAGTAFTHPVNDWKVIDLFTAAPNDNAGRGLLSVNQTNLAAWSAVLTGVMVLTNEATGLISTNIEPFTFTANNPQGVLNTHIETIVNGINGYRTNLAGGVYGSMGAFLAVPELTVKSPYLNTADTSLLSEAAYERLPQQILGLLKVGEPRFVIYAFGQGLKPAADGILLDSPLPGVNLQNLCTNYQITSEMVTRTVLRVEGPADKPKAVIESFTVLPEN